MSEWREEAATVIEVIEGHGYDLPIDSIANALEAAYQRGRKEGLERGAEIVEDRHFGMLACGRDREDILDLANEIRAEIAALGKGETT